MNSENTSCTIKQIMGQAISSQVRRFTYCVIDDTSETKVGTCVAVQLGNRFFLATAAHVIENVHDIKVIVRDQVVEYVSHFAAIHCDTRLDLGVLEISPSDSHRFEDFLSQGRLCETIEDKQKLPTMVVGFCGQFCKPVEQIDIDTENTLRVVCCNTLDFHTFVLPRSKWPSEGLPDESGVDKQLVDGRDMLIDFEHKPEIMPFTKQSTGKKNPPVECQSLDPGGMSGGGIWLAQIREGEEKLHSPDARLIGLQLGWHRTSKLLHGIRIGAWLDFVRGQYPDL